MRTAGGWRRRGIFVRSLRAAIAAAILMVEGHVAAGAAGSTAAMPTTQEVGEAIFRGGRLPSGRALEAVREGTAPARGAAAACANCHRRSGLGSREGLQLVPPIAGRYLFHDPDRTESAVALPYVEGIKSDRPAYTDETLARAIREGVDSRGRPLNYLMPRFRMSDADMASLIAYLRELGARDAPGVDDTVLHFATIITPDADPVARAGMLDVLQHFFADKNAFVRAAAPALLASGRTMYSKSMYRANRHWELSIWQLGGPASTWQAQLERFQAREPVYAVVSGLGGSDWRPVHAFCERARIPCLFPNVLAPPASADKDFYSIYFSSGVTLEASLIGHELQEGVRSQPVASVRQVYRAGDVGEIGAKALASTMGGARARIESIPIAAAGKDDAVAAAVARAAGADVVVLWLRPPDLAALAAVPAPAGSAYVSGLMGGLERTPLPPAWREAARISYPVDLPDQRRYRVDYAMGWFSIRHIPVVAPQVQADTYLACGVLAETLTQTSDAFERDYLVERIEDMIEHRIVTGYYPRLTLGTGQRFASKGGYVTHFTDPDGTRMAIDDGWITP